MTDDIQNGAFNACIDVIKLMSIWRKYCVSYAINPIYTLLGMDKKHI